MFFTRAGARISSRTCAREETVEKSPIRCRFECQFHTTNNAQLDRPTSNPRRRIEVPTKKAGGRLTIPMICKCCLLTGFSNGEVVVFHFFTSAFDSSNRSFSRLGIRASSSPLSLSKTSSFFRLLHFVLGNFHIYFERNIHTIVLLL